MEPISVIIAALVAGAAKAAGDAAPDAYNGLKSLIQRKFAGEPTAETVLEKHATAPKDYQRQLQEKLAEAGADKDPEIIKAAQKLLKQIKPEESAAGKYNIEADQIKGNIGDIQAEVFNQTFN